MIRALTCLVFCLTASLAMGQSYEMTVTDANAAEGGLYTQNVDLTVMSDSSVSGWSTSVCHDSSLSDVCGAELPAFVLGLNQIGNLFFQSVAIDDRATTIPGSVDGAASGIVIDQQGFFFFPDNSTNTVLVVTYAADAGTNGMTSTTDICSSVGNPVVEAVVVCCGGASVPASDPSFTQVSGTVTYGPAEAQWDFTVDGATDVSYNPMDGSGGGSQTLNLLVANTAANTINNDTGGFSMGITVDPTFVTVDAINIGAAHAALQQQDGGLCNNPTTMGPDVLMTNVTGTGASIQVQNSAFPAIPVLPYCFQPVDAGAGTAFATIDITVDTSSLMGDLVGGSTTIAWGDAGDAVDNTVTVNCPGDNLFPLGGPNINLNDATINLNPEVDLAFIRGDCNDDGIVNIADAIWTISGYLAMPPIGSEGPCAEACDANDDGSIDVADVSYTLSYRFSMGSPPPAPFPSCGTEADAPCDASQCP